MRVRNPLRKAGKLLSVSCLLFFSTYDVATAKSNTTQKCQIKEIPQKSEAYIDKSPNLLARKKSGKWIALDHVITKKNVADAYECISKEMLNAYKKSKLDVALIFRNWLKVNKISFYAPANDFGWGNIFVNFCLGFG